MKIADWWIVVKVSVGNTIKEAVLDRMSSDELYQEYLYKAKEERRRKIQ